MSRPDPIITYRTHNPFGETADYGCDYIILYNYRIKQYKEKGLLYEHVGSRELEKSVSEADMEIP